MLKIPISMPDSLASIVLIIPSAILTCPDGARLADLFRAFWESEVPRAGEENAIGWSEWFGCVQRGELDKVVCFDSHEFPPASSVRSHAPYPSLKLETDGSAEMRDAFSDDEDADDDAGMFGPSAPDQSSSSSRYGHDDSASARADEDAMADSDIGEFADDRAVTAAAASVRRRARTHAAAAAHFRAVAALNASGTLSVESHWLHQSCQSL
jgi:hypothetical protein